jgi:hypothetical protein
MTESRLCATLASFPSDEHYFLPFLFAFAAAVSAALLPLAGCVAALFAVDTLPGGLPGERSFINSKSDATITWERPNLCAGKRPAIIICRTRAVVTPSRCAASSVVKVSLFMRPSITKKKYFAIVKI